MAPFLWGVAVKIEYPGIEQRVGHGRKTSGMAMAPWHQHVSNPAIEIQVIMEFICVCTPRQICFESIDVIADATAQLIGRPFTQSQVFWCPTIRIEFKTTSKNIIQVLETMYAALKSITGQHHRRLGQAIPL